MRAGYDVVATCRSPATATALLELQRQQEAGTLLTSGRLLGVVALDLADAESVKEALARVQEELGLRSLDVLINNAAIASDKHPDETVMEALPEDMMRVFQTNVVGPMLVTQTFYPLLLAASSSSSLKASTKKARVINVSSRMGSISLYQGTQNSCRDECGFCLLWKGSQQEAQLQHHIV